MKEYIVNDINRLNINTGNDNIIISSGDGIITIPDNYNAIMNNDCVYIKQIEIEEKKEDTTVYTGINSIWNNSSVVIGNKKINNCNSETIDIRLNPEEDYYLVLRTSIGTIKINNISIKKLIANTIAGDIILKDVYSENTIITSLIGDMSLEINDSMLNCDSCVYSMLGNTSKKSIEEDPVSSIQSSLMANSYTGNIKVLFKGRKLD